MKYNSFEIKDVDGTIIDFKIAKSKCRTMHITINSDGIVKAVCPKYVSNTEFEKFLFSKLKWVRKTLEKFAISGQNSVDVKISTLELKNKILEFIEYYKNRFFIDFGYKINPRVIKFGKSKTQWGSCTKDSLLHSGIIRFSAELCKCNDSFIEAVVIHELCHLIEANHSKKFWNLVYYFIPNYNEIKEHKY